jgi:hypothetical protein
MMQFLFVLGRESQIVWLSGPGYQQKSRNLAMFGE